MGTMGASSHPSLLSGAGTWLGGCTTAVELCNDVQNFFWRVMLGVLESCPKIALQCETKMIGMKWRVWQEKILLLLRIKSHDADVLCRKVYDEGVKNGWPGLWKEVTQICEEIGIPDVNYVKVSKHDIKKAIFENHYNDMVKIVKTKTKLENIQDEDFHEIQDYFGDKSVENTRMAFRIRTQMVRDIPGNYKNKYKVKGTVNEGLVCSECDTGETLTQSHCLTCPTWAELRTGLDLTNIQDLVVFFRKLLVERAKV